MIPFGYYLNPDNLPALSTDLSFLLTGKPHPLFWEAKKKHCNYCGEHKPVEEFSIKRYKRDGTPSYSSQCKECYAKQKKEERDGVPVLREQEVSGTGHKGRPKKARVPALQVKMVQPRDARNRFCKAEYAVLPAEETNMV